EKTARFASQWINEKNLQKPTSKYIPELREYIDSEIKKLHNERTADAQEVMEYLTSVLRGKSKSEIVVIEGEGDGMSSARRMEKAPDEKERLKAAEPVLTFSGEYIMAVPLKFYDSQKYSGRGKSIFSGGKSDCFDALDEVISQWWDALRMGRVKQYIPESFIPRKPDNGSLLTPNKFGNDYITTAPPITEGVDNQKIEVVQPDIKYEAFVSSYTNAMLMCLQGLVSPATLEIDVGKMSSADAQREKKDVTGNTRNTITATLEKALPQLIEAILKTYDNILEKEPKDCDVTVSFGEYGAPDFDSRVETIGKAASYGIMSVETQVAELWGSSKDDEWKAAEVTRLKDEKQLSVSDASVGDELDI
ncbi:MAG: terminase small subunit, partial [Lachnospiraceae bacterium]|nr:terminase small subunit [Lachnospiraceae bacterium]